MDDDDATSAITTTTTLLFITNEEVEEEEDCWSDLHKDMIHLIFKRFTTEADYIRLGSVCASWRSMQLFCLHPDLLHPQLPLLMIPTPPPPLHHQLTTITKLQPEEETQSFYRVSEKSVCKDLQITLPHNRYCCGSSHGWVITTGNEDTGYSVELFNPFISVNNEYKKIQLPPLTTLPEEIFNRMDYMRKAIVSVNPSTHPKDYVVMGIYGGMRRLGFWRPGDQAWTGVKLGWKSSGMTDVIYLKGLFYAINAKGVVFVIDDDLDRGSAGVRLLTSGGGLYRPAWSFKWYLVESEGDLLCVNRGVSSLQNDMVFQMLKLVSDDQNGGGTTWIVVNTLPERMLFVGNNASISLAASDFPGGKSSCIYFTEDDVINWQMGCPCNGIFSMGENKIIERFDYISSANTIWVEPTLRRCFRL